AGQHASVAIKSVAHEGPQNQQQALGGVVVNINLRSDAPVEDVFVNLEGSLPAWVGPGANVEGIIDLGQQLDDVLSVGRPVYGQQNSEIELFKLSSDGKGAVQVKVRLGAASWNRIEIVSGLQEGDRVIISDTSRFENAPEISIK
ncbi:MAG TPA: hypothetical protein VI756_17785, partial [Blastocatellia bacterium]